MIRLSKSQEKVCNLAAKGLSDKEIAYALNISESTVNLHLWEAKKKFNVKNRTKLALKYLEDRGLIKYTTA